MCQCKNVLFKHVNAYKDELFSCAKDIYIYIAI